MKSPVQRCVLTASRLAASPSAARRSRTMCAACAALSASSLSAASRRSRLRCASCATPTSLHAAHTHAHTQRAAHVTRMPKHQGRADGTSRAERRAGLTCALRRRPARQSRRLCRRSRRPARPCRPPPPPPCRAPRAGRRLAAAACPTWPACGAHHPAGQHLVTPRNRDALPLRHPHRAPRTSEGATPGSAGWRGKAPPGAHRATAAAHHRACVSTHSAHAPYACSPCPTSKQLTVLCGWLRGGRRERARRERAAARRAARPGRPARPRRPRLPRAPARHGAARGPRRGQRRAAAGAPLLRVHLDAGREVVRDHGLDPLEHALLVVALERVVLGKLFRLRTAADGPAVETLFNPSPSVGLGSACSNDVLREGRDEAPAL